MQTFHKWKLAATHQISEEFSWTYVGWSIISVTASSNIALPHRDVFQTQENILFILSILLSVQKHCRQAESRTSSRWSSNSRLVSMHLQMDSSQRTLRQLLDNIGGTKLILPPNIQQVSLVFQHGKADEKATGTRSDGARVRQRKLRRVGSSTKMFTIAHWIVGN